MGNTLLIVIDQYYEYVDSLNTNKRGITIGCYGSTQLAHSLVALSLLDNLGDIFKTTLMYHEIDRDVGVVFFKRQWSNKYTNRWI